MYILLQVVDIMRVNVDKVLERDQKISELDDRAGKVKDLERFLILNDYKLYGLLNIWALILDLLKY